ncbi:MAG: hypothetical protein FWD34_01170 [Oscillospiraceae bacterium]|nr:hypothetical protein [Oscillospiraceae bacterium]
MGLAGEIGKGILGSNNKAKIIVYKTKDDRASTDKEAEFVAGKLLGVSVPSVGGIGDKNYHVMTVQFNPSTVRFEASTGTVRAKDLEDSFDNAIINQQERKASVVMSVDLIFDAVSNKDAFHGDKFRLSPTDIAGSVGTIAKNLGGGYSVQKQTNGFIGAMMHESTRVITFVWAKMLFTGALKQVQAKYTMFSPSGRPIRSTVTMQLQQMIDIKDVSYWDNAFSDFFGKPGIKTDMIEGKSQLESMKRFLNIGF